MPGKHHIPQKVAAILVYGRPPLIFGGMLCAIAVMLAPRPILYTLGVSLLFIAMSFDLVDGWFAARFYQHSPLAPLADRLVDKLVYSIVFPLVAVGTMWRLYTMSPDPGRGHLIHALFVLLLTITVLVRDNFAHFMRGFALRQNQEPEESEFTRLRTIVAAPVAALLYAHAFYVPEGPPSPLYFWISWLGNLPLRVLFFIEIVFLVINFGSIAAYCRKYGTLCLDELCLGDEGLRRKILAFFPNALTVMNAMMGLLAVFFAYQGRIREAFLILIGATLFDKLDGAVARKLGLAESSPNANNAHSITLGGLLDDISDAVSFCIAPAWIFYILFTGYSDPVLDRLPVGLVAWLYALLGIARLIYFTVDRTPIPGFFKGLPTPAAAMVVSASFVIFNQAISNGGDGARFWGIFCFIVMILTALVMNLYRIRYLHLGRYMSRHPWFARVSLVVLLSVFTPYFGHACFLYMFLYMLSPLVTWRIDPQEAAKETRLKPLNIR